MKDINGPVLDLPSTLPGPNKIYNRSAFFLFDCLCAAKAIRFLIRELV